MNVEETKPGHFSINCEVSKMPITRSNKFGMFCDADQCKCEKKAEASYDSMKQFVNNISRMFSND